MFEFIRTHKRFLQFVLLILILPSFVFFGVQGYSRFMEGDQALARIDKAKVTQQELDNAMRQRVDQMRQQFGAQIDARMIDTPEARKAMLDQLVDQQVVAAEIRSNSMVVSDAYLRDTIAAIPAVQKDGKFDLELYQRALASQGLSEQGFESRLRGDIASARVAEVFSATSIVPQTVLEKLARQAEQPISFREQLFRAADFAPKVIVNDEALKKYYDSNVKQFEQAERLKAEYVVLDLATVSKMVEVKAEDIKAFYDKNQDRFKSEEQRKASHILIKADKSAPAADLAKAKARAEALLVQVKAAPGNFAKIAREASQDEGSAPNGGDLGFFGRGAMVKPFEDAVFAMKDGEISSIVQSDFGFHIIQLTGLKTSTVRPFEEVRAEIESEQRKNLAAKKYAEMAESFTNTVFEQSDSFKPVVEKMKLQVNVADGITRDRINQPTRPGDVLTDRVIESLFSTDSLKNRRNTEAIEVAPNTLVSARVVDYQAARTPPLDEIKVAVQARFVAQESARLAREAGLVRLQALQKAPAELAGLGEVRSVSRASAQNVPSQVVSALARASAGKLPASVGVDIPGQGYGVYVVTALGDVPTLSDDRRAQLTSALQRVTGDLETRGLLADLRQQHKVKILKTDFAKQDEVAASDKSGKAVEKK
jgi:peptidyl-prolyl cis-trans isomerase D